MKRYWKQMSFLMATATVIAACAEDPKEPAKEKKKSEEPATEVTIDTTGGFTPASGVTSVEQLTKFIQNQPKCQRPSNQRIFASLAHGCLIYQLKYLHPEYLPSNLENIASIRTFVARLNRAGDPFTFRTQSSTSSQRSSVASQLDQASIGISVSIPRNNINARIPLGFMKVNAVQLFSAAWFEDIRVDDQITEINGVSLSGKTYRQALNLISKNEGTNNTLKIFRGGFITRTIKSQNYFSFKVNDNGQKDNDGNYGYIRIKQFGNDAGGKLIEYAKAFKDDGIDKFIVDLRGNGGGLVSQAWGMADYLVPSSENLETAFTFKDKDQQVQNHRLGLDILRNSPSLSESFKKLLKPFETDTNLATTKDKTKLVILVDKNSASASEMVAGIVQAYDSATVIGRTTFGKGVSQTGYSLVDRSVLWVTQNKIFLTDSSESYHKKGIVPDLAVSHKMSVGGSVDPKNRFAINFVTSPALDNQLKQATLFLKNGSIARNQLVNEGDPNAPIASSPDQLQDTPLEPIVDPLQRMLEEQVY